MKKLLIFPILFASLSVFAQKADTVLTKKDSIISNKDSIKSAKQSNYFDKYKKQTAATPKSNQPNLNLPQNKEKKVESSYEIENNRVTGGSTTIKVGDKKKKKN